MQPINETHEIFPVTIKETKNGAPGLPAVACEGGSDVALPSLPLSAETGQKWALLAISKDSERAAQLNVEFNLSGAKQPLSFLGQVEVIQFLATAIRLA